VLANWIRTHKIDTIQGKLRFDGPSNYGDDLMVVKQVQNGRWVVVWPKDKAAPGATLIVR
jgi:branched-chain amino acid transport system substrate-binding protein